MYKHMSSHIFCMIIKMFLIQNVQILSVFTNLMQSGATCRETPFLSCDPPPSNYVCLIQMLCHRCYLAANFWVNVFTFYYIGIVISISVLSFYSDRYYFSFHVVDILVLQSFGLAIITLVDPAQQYPFFPTLDILQLIFYLR